MSSFTKKIKGFAKRRLGPDLFPSLRRLRNKIVGNNVKLPDEKYAEYKDGLKFADKETYLAQEKYYITKHETFEEYSADKNNEPKKYVDLDFGVFYQTFNHKKATFECLKSFRKFYPKIPVCLISDHGADLADIALAFDCRYEYADKELGYQCTDMRAWFQRIADACLACGNPEWMFFLEDDILTRDRISKYPNAHIAGQGGGSLKLANKKQLSPEVIKYVEKLFPNTEWNGIAGCGGTIFHTRSFLKSLESNIGKNFDSVVDKLDESLKRTMDQALTFLLMANGYLCRAWFDLSEEANGKWGPASAFDHQYKKYYKQEWSNADEKELESILKRK